MSFRNAPHSHTPTAGMAEMLASADRREKAKQQQAKGSSGGFRDQTNSKSSQGSQAAFSGSKTPSTAKKGAAVGKEQVADAGDDGDFRAGAAAVDGEVKKAKRTRPKVDADLLAGNAGLAAILKTFPSLKQELKGEGHEAHDVRLLISRMQVCDACMCVCVYVFIILMQMWAWKMAPAVSFPDAVNTLEKLGHTIRVQVPPLLLAPFACPSRSSPPLVSGDPQASAVGDWRGGGRRGGVEQHSSAGAPPPPCPLPPFSPSLYLSRCSRCALVQFVPLLYS